MRTRGALEVRPPALELLNAKMEKTKGQFELTNSHDIRGRQIRQSGLTRNGSMLISSLDLEFTTAACASWNARECHAS